MLPLSLDMDVKHIYDQTTPSLLCSVGTAVTPIVLSTSISL